MAGGQFSTAKLFGMTIRESANDGSDFTNPDADYRRLFLGEDGLLHLKDSAGTVTDIGGGSGIAATIFDAKGDLIVASAADTAARLAAGSDGQGLIYRAGATAGIEPVEILPWTVQILPWFPKSTTGWAFLVQTSAVHNAVMASNNQNDEITWDVVLAQGTWTFSMLHRKDNDRGIYTVTLGGSSIGTIDGYNATAQASQTGTIAGVAVATTGKVELKLAMLTKNASSSGYTSGIHFLQLRRTA